MTGSIRRWRTHSRIVPGVLSGTMRPETQMLVSMTTRSPVSPHLFDRRGDVTLHLHGFPSRLSGSAPAAVKEKVETAGPRIFVDRLHALCHKPCIDRLTNEDRNGPTLTPTDEPQCAELFVRQVDVRTSHHPYIIHR